MRRKLVSSDIEKIKNLLKKYSYSRSNQGNLDNNRERPNKKKHKPSVANEMGQQLFTAAQ